MIAAGDKNVLRISCLALLAASCLALLVPRAALAGNWRVTPIKLFFNAQNRSEVITVTNDGDQALTLEVSAARWTQDETGQDVYQPASDLVFFPRQLSVEPHSERVIRAGIKVPAAGQEKTYRLFIREIPDQRAKSANTVAIAIQFGVPVFVAPLHEEVKGAVAEATLKDGRVDFTVQNLGNSHFRINTVTLQALSPSGEVLFAKELEGWYLLAGRDRTFSATLPAQPCLNARTLNIQVNADRIKLDGKIDVDKAMCAAP